MFLYDRFQVNWQKQWRAKGRKKFLGTVKIYLISRPGFGKNLKKSLRPFIFPEKKTIRPLFFFKKPVLDTDMKFKFIYLLWVYANERTRVTWPNMAYFLTSEMPFFEIWNLDFQNIVEKKLFAQFFFSKKSIRPPIFLDRNLFASLSMVPARIPDKFWPVP